MRALFWGFFAERTEASLAAGCDVVFHCNGVMERDASGSRAPPTPLAGMALERADRACKLLSAGDGLDIAPLLRAEFQSHFEVAV